MESVLHGRKKIIMNTILKYALLALGVSAGVLGCQRSESQYDSSTNVSAREVKKEMKEAVDATKTYVGQTKDQFVASM